MKATVKGLLLKILSFFTVTKTTFTPTSGQSYANFGGCYYQKQGNRVRVHIGMSGLTANGGNSVYTMPTGYRPETAVYTVGTAGALGYYATVEIRANGVIYITPTQPYCGADIEYLI